MTRYKHELVSHSLRDRILTGDLPPGAAVPSERRLTAEWGFTRETIRKALRTLEQEGQITGGPRRVVTEHKPVTLRISDEESVTFIADLVAAGHVTAPPQITVKIEGGWLVREVLRVVDGVPHNWARWRFPLDRAQGTRLAYDTDIPEGSIRYVKEGLQWSGLTQDKWIEARMPSPAETAVLEMSGGPVLVEHREGNLDGTLVFDSVRILRADRTRLVP